MKYRANPVIVDAWRITGVAPALPSGHTMLYLDDPDAGVVIASPEMTERMWPSVGDYVVKQEDGYIYLNPRHVFERKYSPVPVEQQRPHCERCEWERPTR
jgi:hypothetical protein